ncbi:DUF1911 domain-containing protein [Ruminococcus sp. MSJ-25]|uniref:PoNe immunity protein domain-containing protein n=1 Tax=unclassified Ruminococcus TaxID=2608920 RepID=UPI001C0F42B7|nr:PoNe immunity protein domain-containing protein [Ruminococcus sp. MSJ-25]MBU5406827.1 DUF1911 domain-containing protein [Ruminococcus sp. MSJ-25]
MRDSIRTKAYFDEFIAQEKERICKFQDKLNSGSIDDERVPLINNKIIYLKTDLIIAKYSRGDSINDIKNEFEELIDMVCEKGDVSIYEDNLCLASLAYLLGVNSDKMMRLRSKLMESETYDYLIDFVFLGSESDIDINKISFQREYKKLTKYIDDRTKETFLKYLRGWYRSHFHSSWYDSHKNEKFKLYFGYWCFEAGAIAKRLQLDDNDLQNEQYYPYDMVHFN